jgi:RNA polymerase sigma-70 factor (ECF subfamily)
MSEPSGEVARSIADARAGSRAALGRVLDACRGYLLLVAQGELAPELRAKGGGASDLVQDTLLEAFRDFDKFRGESEDELVAWLRRLLLNNVADFARQYRATDKRRLDREVAPGGESSSAPGGRLVAAGPSPSSAAAAVEQAVAVLRVLDRLPEEYRQVIVLRYQDERSFDEIGGELGLTANAARKLLVRAIERVQAELGGPR